ncbi:MAG: ATP-grasp domain-containing protein [Nanoarchaeota archaeon]|nr:ATP-grasp domain-containing protein [Nanoarchaeota archaeon]
MKGFLIFPALHIGNKELLFCLKSLEEINDRILVVMKPTFFEKMKPSCKHYILDDFEEMELLLEKLDSKLKSINATPTGILSIDDDAQFDISEKISKRFKIPFYEKETLLKSSNKYLMKRAFDEVDVLNAEYGLISEAKEAKVGYPCVLKLVQGSGSEFISLNQNQAELARNLASVKKAVATIQDSWFNITEGINPRESFLVEKLLSGLEFSADFLICDGKVSIIRIVKKFNSSDLGYFLGFHLINEETLHNLGIDKGELTKMFKRIALGFGISEGVCMVDFMLCEGQLKVIESSIRPGLSTFVPLMQKLYGYTSIAVLAKAKLGMLTSIEMQKKEGAVVHIIAARDGYLKSIDISEAKNIPGVLDIHLYSKPGDKIETNEHDKWNRFLGYALVKLESNEIQKIFEEVSTSIVLEISNEKD